MNGMDAIEHDAASMSRRVLLAHLIHRVYAAAGHSDIVTRMVVRPPGRADRVSGHIYDA